MAPLTVNKTDYYQTLEVSHAADFREIGAGYWRLARGAGSEQRAELNAAYETLNNEDRRRAYDAQWAEAGHVEEPRTAPADAPPQPEPAPAQPANEAKADLAREEPRTAPADAHPAPLMAQANPNPEREEPAHEAGDSFAERLGWPKAM
jgi:curved DNA-binding protein CbpA